MALRQMVVVVSSVDPMTGMGLASRIVHQDSTEINHHQAGGLDCRDHRGTGPLVLPQEATTR